MHTIKSPFLLKQCGHHASLSFFLSPLGDSRQRQQWWLGDCKGGWEAVEVLPSICQHVTFYFSSSCHMSLSWIDDDYIHVCENRNSDSKIPGGSSRPSQAALKEKVSGGPTPWRRFNWSHRRAGWDWSEQGLFPIILTNLVCAIIALHFATDMFHRQILIQRHVNVK